MAYSQKLKGLHEEHPDIEFLSPSDAKWSERRETRGQAGQQCKPLGIAIPKTADQVANIVRWASAQHVEITVRTGGNDYFGRNVVNDGLIIDMRAINSIKIAADKGSATIGGGVITKDLIYKLDDEGLMAPFGNTWIVGYVGWATLGGYGPLTHALGMGFEGILGAQVVTGQGEVVDASDDRLGGIRGMGGNLGIITSLTIKVYPATKVRVCSGTLLMAAGTDAGCCPTLHRFFQACSCLMQHRRISELLLPLSPAWRSRERSRSTTSLSRYNNAC